MALFCAVVGGGGCFDPPKEEPSGDVEHGSGLFSVVEVSPEQGTLESLLAQEAAAAVDVARRPFLQVYAEWCGPCVSLRAAMVDPQMQRAFAGTHIVLVNADLWRVPLDRSPFANHQIPRFHELDPGGQPTGRFLTGAAWGDDTPENMAPNLSRFFQDRRRVMAP